MLHLNGYNSPLGPQAMISTTTMDPGVGCMEAPTLVSSGKFDMGITTPGWYGRLALEGKPPFSKPQTIRGLALFPHDDRMAFLIRKNTGIKSIREIVDQKYPLRYSIPTSETHPAIWGADQILSAYGTSRAEIESWGGKRLRDRPRALADPTVKPVSDEWEAVIDEAIMTARWKNLVAQYDVEFLPIDDNAMRELESRGMRPGVIEKERFSCLTANVPTIDFSDWLLFCRADLPDEVAYQTARVMDEHGAEFNERIGPDSGLTGAVDAATFAKKMPIPLHPGAEKYYRERGYL